MRSFALAICLLGIFILSGCATGSATHHVEIFRDGTKPNRDFAEIGVLTDDGTLGEQGAIEDQMIRKAKKRGADALLFEKLSATGEELKGLGLSTTYLYKAYMVVYR